MRPARVHPVALPHEDGFAPGKRVEYVISPFEILDERRKKEREESMAKRVAGEFKTAAGDKPLGDRPSHLLAGEMLGYLKKWIQEDWPEASVHTYVNEKHMIVVRFGEGSVESRKGLEAYMNIFSRCNSLVDKYRLTKVGGYWDLAPGDGNIYYTFCPPWVRYNRLENFFSRRPEERHWASSSVTAELAKDRAAMLAEIRSVEGILMAAFLEAHEGTPEARVITDLR